jgi:hypothetical protein
MLTGRLESARKQPWWRPAPMVENQPVESGAIMDARPQRSRTVSALLALAVVLAACQSADDASLVAPAPLPPATADPSEADDDRPAPEAAVVDEGPEAEEAEEAEQAAGDTASPSASAGFRLELGQDLSIGGVSPELIADPRGGYLLLTTGMSTDKAYRSSDAITFTPDPSTQVPQGNDYSLLQRPDGTWLLYYVVATAPAGQPGQPPDPSKALKTVMVSQSSDLASFGPGSPTGIGQQVPGPAWGVPDTYRAPDGTYRMMWVDRAPGQNWEVLRTATSADGVTFSADPGYVISDGYVDPFMLRADEGDWVLLLSTTPATQRLPQKIFVARSVDGRTWTIDPAPLLESADRNYLDPAAVQVGDGVWRVVLSAAARANAIQGPHTYVAATLTETR